MCWSPGSSGSQEQEETLKQECSESHFKTDIGPRAVFLETHSFPRQQILFLVQIIPFQFPWYLESLILQLHNKYFRNVRMHDTTI